MCRRRNDRIVSCVSKLQRALTERKSRDGANGFSDARSCLARGKPVLDPLSSTGVGLFRRVEVTSHRQPASPAELIFEVQVFEAGLVTTMLPGTTFSASSGLRSSPSQRATANSLLRQRPFSVGIVAVNEGSADHKQEQDGKGDEGGEPQRPDSAHEANCTRRPDCRG